MNRVKRLASHTKGSSSICDIGCDHAYVLVEAIKNYDVHKAIACDIALGPLENARKTIAHHNLESQVEVVMSNGFSSVQSFFDTAIIAGMGGALICDILEEGLFKIRDKKLILEPNCDQYMVRKFLAEHQFEVIEEESFYDQNKYYEIIVAQPGNAKYDELDIAYGPKLRKQKNEAYVKHYSYKIKLLQEILPSIQDIKRREEKWREFMELSSLLKYDIMEKHFILNTKNYYRTYFVDETVRPLIVVSPGGGYQYTSPRESEPVVDAFLKRGYHVAVVNYRETIEDAYPKTGFYLAEAIKELKKNQRVSKLIGLGFSAGGHCILEVCLHKEKYELDFNLDLLMLGYPVITADERYAHLNSFINLLKEEASNPGMREYLSLETQVTKENAPDLFLWGTYTDEAVSVMNSLLLVESYYRAKANVEYHMFPMGGHGLSVATAASAEGNAAKENPYIAKWVDLACDWLSLKLKQLK